MTELAVVGIACRYPEADSPKELWENVVSQRRSFRPLPSERLRLADYYASDPRTPDAIYSREAALLEDWEFDRVRFRISGTAYRSTDLTHWLALEVAEAALADARFDELRGIERDRVGVVVGNTLTGEFSRSTVMRLRWPYVRRVVGHALAREGWDDARRARFLADLEAEYKAPFPPITEESLAGGLSNTIAGRICNMFDFHGGGYTVDGACAASLLAVITACSSLASGDLDFALAGGVDLSIDPFELVGFAKTEALAPELMRVYDERSQGFWPGEGCGFLALVRHADALEWGLRVYAVVHGWGISSDGRGGITRPEVAGQLLALQRAYARAGYGIDSVELFEGHGTGTAVGDATELGALTQAHLAGGSRLRPAALGSIKANIGHTKAAAGVAGMIKAVLSLDRGVLPPTTGCEVPHSELRKPDAPLRVLRAPEPWPEGRPLRAGVSAMGFGGINTHVALAGVARPRARRLTERERRLARTFQDAELFAFAAPTLAGLAEDARALQGAAGTLGFGQFRDLAIRRCVEATDRPGARAVVVASTPAELEARLHELVSAVEAGETRVVDGMRRFAFAEPARPARIGFLFPGQASPTYLDGGAVARRFEVADAILRESRLEGGPDLRDTAVAQPAIAACSAAGAAVLESLGVEAAVAVGHSLGELAALQWAGAFGVRELVELARARGRAMADCPGENGAMADLATEEAIAAELVAGLPVVIAGFNSASHVVVSGPAAGVEAAIRRSEERGIRATRLPVSHAFHSPLVAPAAEPLSAFLAGLELAPLRRRVVSTVEGGPLPPDADLRELLVKQVTNPVRFTDALAALAPEVDLLLEVGPGRILTDLSAATGIPAVATDAGGPSLAGLLTAVAAAYALGAPVRLGALAAGRVARDDDPLRTRSFLVNPCELAADGDGAALALLPAAESDGRPSAEAAGTPPDGSPREAEEVVRQLVARHVELPLEAVEVRSRLLTDLNLNSITVAQIASDAAAALGVRPPVAPTEFADATVADLVAALAEAEPDDGTDDSAAPPGIAAWLRPFVLHWVRRGRPAGARRPCSWQVVCVSPDVPTAAVEAAFAGGEGEPGLVVAVGRSRTRATAHRFLEAARAALDAARCRRVLVLHHGGGAGGIARTLFVERGDLVVRVVDVPPDASPAALALAREEAETGEGFEEVRLGRDGEREVARLRPVRLEDGATPLGPGDVLLATGGGKGIGAECALALARSTGARLAVLGRSRADADGEVAENLERFRALGVEALYVRADVTDRASVAAAVAEVESVLGAVTGILHSAGTNEPRLLRDLDAETLDATRAPKVDGIENLLAAVDPARLRLLVAFGSIIARTGLAGEGHYALANEWLRLAVDDAAARLPRCRCLTIEWSVWAGVGMGERLGRLELLARAGVTPISPDEGTALLQELLSASGLPGSVVACGRFGDPPTLLLDRPELPLVRFLERPLVYYPGIELVAESALSVATDPYLADHALGSVPLLPAVVGLEAMGEAASALAENRVAGFEDVELSRPITVPVEGSRVIRTVALARDDSRVEVAIRSDETAFAVDHFRAVCRVGPLGVPAPPDPPEVTASVELDGELYGRLLFHGPRFRRVRRYRYLQARRCVAEIDVDPEAQPFSRYLPQTLVLGDFAARDAYVHAAQACIPHRRVLPLSIECAVLLASPVGPVTVTALERTATEETLVYDLAVEDQNGTLTEVWRGLTLKTLEPLAAPAVWPPATFVPYLERRISELVSGARVSVALALDEDGGSARSDRTEEAVAQAIGRRVRVLHRGDGKPEVEGGVAVSVAHDTAYTLAVGGPPPVACDLEVASGRSRAEWRRLLGDERLRVAELVTREGGEALDEAATRIWAAAECLRKAGRPVDEPVVLERVASEGWTILRSGSLRIATLVTRLSRIDEPAVVGILVGEGR